MRRTYTLSLLGALAIACTHRLQGSDREPSEPFVQHVAEQQILTPVPVRVALPQWVAADRVFLHYRVFGDRSWSALELARAGQTWSGAVPCLEISTITGQLRFYVRAFDETDRLVARSGTPSWPYAVMIRRRLPSGTQSLPGTEPREVPVTCRDPADCPPDFPGCPSRAPLRPPCTSHDDCDNGGFCAWDGYCDWIDGAD